MFENLTDKLDGIFRKLRGRSRLDEENIQTALKEIRMALLEADVNFRVVRDFIEEIRRRRGDHVKGVACDAVAGKFALDPGAPLQRMRQGLEDDDP